MLVASRADHLARASSACQRLWEVRRLRSARPGSVVVEVTGLLNNLEAPGHGTAIKVSVMIQPIYVRVLGFPK